MDEPLDEFAFTGHEEWPVTNEEYHASPALSGTRLKRYLGISAPADDSALREGIAIHTWSLQPELEDTIVRRPPVDMTGPRAPRKRGCVEARERWAKEWEEVHAEPGVTVLSPEQYDRARKRADAVSRFEISAGLPMSRAILRRDAMVERSHRFMCYGLEGKRRTDFEIPEYLLSDVKSTAAPSIALFAKDAAKFAYDLSIAWNADSGVGVYGRPKNVGFIAVNLDAEVAWVGVPDSVLAIGAMRYRTALRLARVSMESSDTPPSHWAFAAHMLPDPAPWERSQAQDLASYSEDLERWHRHKMSRDETMEAAQ